LSVGIATTLATSAAKRWVVGALIKLLRSPHLAGQREHHGVLYAASWPGLVTLDDSLRLRSILAPSPGPKAVAKFPLSGVLACGACGTRLVASSEKRRDGSRARRYRCALQSGGCNKVGIVAVPLEDLLLAQTVAFLDSFHARPIAGIESESDQAAVDDLNKIAARRSELASMFARDEVDASTWRMAIAALDEREEAARTQVTAVAAKRNVFTPFVLDGETGQRLLEAWPTMDHDECRTELRKAIDHILIAHADKAANRFDASRVTIVWREGFRLSPVTLAPRSTGRPAR
jgi:site-specific DNA recombinase